MLYSEATGQIIDRRRLMRKYAGLRENTRKKATAAGRIIAARELRRLRAPCESGARSFREASRGIDGRTRQVGAAGHGRRQKQTIGVPGSIGGPDGTSGLSRYVASGYGSLTVAGQGQNRS